MVLSVLGRDLPNWRIKNSCPCCNHRVSGEPRLEYDQMFAIDGGCSLKRLRDAGSADSHTFKSDYYVTPEEVDQFKYEAVKKTTRKSGKGKKKATEEEGEGADQDKEQDIDVTLEVGEAEKEVDEEGQEWITKNVQAEPGLEQHQYQPLIEIILCLF